MRLNGASDMNRSFGLSQAYSRTKQQLATLTEEVSSGLKADVPASTGGDTRTLAAMENRLRRLDAFQANTSEVGLRFDTAQQALDGLQGVMKGLGPSLLAAPLLDSDLGPVLSSAESNLEAALGFINTESAGQFVFAGARSASPAVSGKDGLMAQIDIAIAGLTDADAIAAAVNSFFDAPAGGGGFMDRTLRGTAEPSGGVATGPGEVVSNPLTAADPGFRDTLKGLTLAVLAQRGVAGAEDGTRGRLAAAAGKVVLNAEAGVIGAAARLGVMQQRVEVAETRNTAERSALGIARNGIITADPYETATALKETQGRLDTLYEITAMLSRMSLADRL